MTKFKWKREPASTGRYAWLDNNNLRGYECELISFPGFILKDNHIGALMNVSRSNQSDDTRDWKILVYGKSSITGGNLIFKKRFSFTDVIAAKSFFEQLFIEIMTTEKYPEFKKNILDLGRIIPKN